MFFKVLQGLLPEELDWTLAPGLPVDAQFCGILLWVYGDARQGSGEVTPAPLPHTPHTLNPPQPQRSHLLDLRPAPRLHKDVGALGEKGE